MGLRAASLFSGAGGLDLGIEAAGFAVVSRSDSEPCCCETLAANGRAAKLANIRGAPPLPAGLDLVFGGPPCQSFSSAGAMGGVLDPRGQLVFEFARAVVAARPRLFMMENVRGLATARLPDGEPGGVLRALLSAMEGAGYACRAVVLNAADFGAPQRRVRLFILGALAGAPPDEPHPTRGRDGSPAPWITLGDFLTDHADRDESSWVRPAPRMAEALAGAPDGSGLRSPGKRETTRPGGHWGYKQGGFVADRTLPARTVTASSTTDMIRLPGGSLRRLTLREVAGLQGFPSDWEFCGTRSQRFRQVGNAVPVPLAEAVGRSLAARLASWDASEPLRSAPLPDCVLSAIRRTKWEQRRNGESRRRGAGYNVLRP